MNGINHLSRHTFMEENRLLGQVWTPISIVRDMIDCIPGDIRSYTILDLCAGCGVFSNELIDRGCDPKNITAVEIDPLLCAECEKRGVNILCGDYRDVLEGKSGAYDIVISNPPYQISDGGYGKSAMPIYHKIVEYVIDHLNPQYICMITPSRWMAGGKGLNDYRARMLSDKRIKMITDFPGTSDVFKSVSIAGGVSYFLWDKNHNGSCEFNGVPRDLDEFDVLVRDNTSVSILKKVLKKHKGPFCDFCDSKVLPRKPFGLPTNFKDWVDEGTEGAVKCYCTVRDGFEKWISPKNVVDNHRVLSKHNVLTSAVSYEGAAFKGGERRVFTKLFVADKFSVCIETYIVTGSFDTRKEANSYVAYMKTKFYRFMLSLKMISQHINTQKFAWVPDFEDYTVEYTDQDLYEYFGLTKKESDHIEKTIKKLK